MGAIGFEQPAWLTGAAAALAAGGGIALWSWGAGSRLRRRAGEPSPAEPPPPKSPLRLRRPGAGLGRPGGRAAIGWLIRGLLIGLVLSALGRPTWKTTEATGPVVVLVDHSASVTPGWSEAILSQLPGRLGEAEAVVFRFAGQAGRIDPAPAGAALAPADPADGSDPRPALRLADATLEGAPAPVLMLTDGNWTLGGLAEPGRADDWAAAWRGVPGRGGIWALCPARGRANAGLVDLTTAVTDAAAVGPARPDGAPGRPRGLLVRASLSATRDGPATVRLSVLDPPAADAWRPVRQTRVDLSAGQRRAISWVIPLGADPNVQVRAEVAAEWDELAGDNSLTALAPAPSGRRHCLVIAAGAGAAAGATVQVLGGLGGWQVLTRTPAAAARSGLLAAVQPPAVVILDDVAAEHLPGALVAQMRRHVEAGGGLLVVGGPNALAAGHYYDSPLEPLLPVRSRPREHPATAVVLLLDRSGSMNEPPTLSAGAGSPIPTRRDWGAPTTGPDQTRVAKLDLVKQAVLGLGDLFGPADRLAVIGFADQARAIYQTRPGEGVDWRAVRRSLLEMPASGGTAIEPALRTAADWLARQDVPRRHLLLLTDGQFSDLTVEQAADILATADVAQPPPAVTDARPRPRAGGPEATTQPVAPRLAALTVSTFATSEQADREFLPQLAGRFNGSYYPPGDWGRLRNRFRADLAGAIVEPILSGPIRVEAVGDRPTLPEVRRLLTSELREGARLWYVGRAVAAGGGPGRPWPLVAVGRVGAGRCAVIATSLSSGWAGRWRAGGAAGGLLAALLGDVAGGGDDPRFVLQVVPAAGAPGGERESRLGLDVWVRQPGGSGGNGRPAPDEPINLLDLSARLIDGAGRRRTFPLPQVGPGHYYAEVPSTGLARLAIVQQTATGERVVLRQVLGSVRAALPIEFARLAPRPAALDAFCRRHGGRLLDSLEQLGELKPARRSRSRPLWPWLLLAAVVLFLLDVVVSRPGGADT